MSVFESELAHFFVRQPTSGASVRDVLSSAYGKSPELQAIFPDGPEFHDLWVWANTEGLFQQQDIRLAVAPIPPIRLIWYFSGEMTEQRFVHSGTLHFSLIERLLRRHGYSFYNADSILDWGCGVGRVGRLFAGLDGRYVGCDINGAAVRFLDSTMGFGSFQLSEPTPPLPFEDAEFDIVFSISVLTHLSERAMHHWLEELYRVLKPGGALVQTVLGRKALHIASAWPGAWHSVIGVDDESFETLRNGFASRGFAWAPHRFAVEANDDYGIAIQSDRYIAENWTHNFHLLEVVPGGIDDWQDVVLLRKPLRTDEPRKDPILPKWPRDGVVPPESIALSVPNRLRVGGALTVEAQASGGDDIHYRFSVDRPLVGRIYLTDWQAEPRTTYRPSQPGLAEVVVEANSGAGYHCAAAVSASAETIVTRYDQ